VLLPAAAQRTLIHIAIMPGVDVTIIPGHGIASRKSVPTLDSVQ
jgi:hypothetical protein